MQQSMSSIHRTGDKYPRYNVLLGLPIPLRPQPSLAMSIRCFRWNDLQVYVDPAPQVLRLEMDEIASWREMRHLPLRKGSDTGGIQVLEYDVHEQFEAPIYPTVSALPDEGPFVSAAVLAQKAKEVDDGIVASLELLLDDGTMRLTGRSAWLAGLQRRLQDDWDRSPGDKSCAEAIGLLSALRTLAGNDNPTESTSWPPELRLRRSRCLRDFREKDEVNVPLGIYSWSERLAGLYRLGKCLQQPLSAEVAAVLGHALERDDSLRAAYKTHLALAKVTNPLVGSDVLSWSHSGANPQGQPSLFPASESPEGRLLKHMVGAHPVPPNFDLIGELIARITDRRLNLATNGESGWYDHVLHALEPLIVSDQGPESAKLELAEDYRDDLRELFRSLLGSARESHVKQLEALYAGGCPLVIQPRLTVEPLAEHYRRRAASYRFIREKLVELLGEDMLLTRNRMNSKGGTDLPLLDEIIRTEQLFAGASAIVQDELGIAPDVKPQDERWIMAAKAATRAWISSHRNDPDLAEDVRMMVPLFKDIGHDEFHVLATVGYEQRNLKVCFVDRPEVAVRDSLGKPVQPEIRWDDARYPLARPVTIACRVKRLLDRKQFRALCDREKTVSAIRSALEDS